MEKEEGWDGLRLMVRWWEVQSEGTAGHLNGKEALTHCSLIKVKVREEERERKGERKQASGGPALMKRSEEREKLRHQIWKSSTVWKGCVCVCVKRGCCNGDSFS